MTLDLNAIIATEAAEAARGATARRELLRTTLVPPAQLIAAPVPADLLAQAEDPDLVLERHDADVLPEGEEWTRIRTWISQALGYTSDVHVGTCPAGHERHGLMLRDTLDPPKLTADEWRRSQALIARLESEIEPVVPAGVRLDPELWTWRWSCSCGDAGSMALLRVWARIPTIKRDWFLDIEL